MKDIVKINFTKMHGAGNDFVVIDCRHTAPAHEFFNNSSKPKDIADTARSLCRRKFGVGADQLLLLFDSVQADFRMAIYNADGSEVEMCGNGIRCFANYIWNRAISDKEVLSVETLAGIIRPRRAGDLVEVDMGEPVLDGRSIPVNIDGNVIDFPVSVEGKEFRITCVGMGNPHAVVFVEDVEHFSVESVGPVLETAALFPNRTNVEFVQVVSEKELKMRVWERGAGETLACGTGACASAVAAALKGTAGRDVVVHLKGGDLSIQWNSDNRVFMTGPAVEVFEGTIEIAKS